MQINRLSACNNIFKTFLGTDCVFVVIEIVNNSYILNFNLFDRLSL
jgi:hypothetical protein